MPRAPRVGVPYYTCRGMNIIEHWDYGSESGSEAYSSEGEDDEIQSLMQKVEAYNQAGKHVQVQQAHRKLLACRARQGPLKA